MIPCPPLLRPPLVWYKKEQFVPDKGGVLIGGTTVEHAGSSVTIEHAVSCHCWRRDTWQLPFMVTVLIFLVTVAILTFTVAILTFLGADEGWEKVGGSGLSGLVNYPTCYAYLHTHANTDGGV